ncbi:MAG: glycosyltransferase family 4 protein [Chloroflexi bacterium]|nr:glycosyltransferase family 4 protein [Chloroflexota bacterium]
MKVAVEKDFHVAINAHILSGRAWYRSAGVHQYIYHLLRHLHLDDNDVRYTILLGEGELPPDITFSIRQSRWPTSRAAVRVLWEQLVQPWVLRRIDADLVHGPVFVGPLFASCPTVVTIHDLSFIRFPNLFRPANRLYLTALTRFSARRARRLIAVSAHAAAEAAQLLDVPSERIDVVYHGVDPVFRPISTDEVAAFRERQGIPEQFVLFLGTLEPRKNLVRLVEAFARIYDDKTKLVLAGGKGWLYDTLFARVESLGLENAVIFPGYVASDDLPLWYNAATTLAYPSIYEGFGLPVLEAQACGTPVLTSNVSSLPEAAGDAALIVDPYDVEALAAGLNQMLTNEPLRRELRERGLAHASRFSWTRTAQETASVYRQVLTKGRET